MQVDLNLDAKAFMENEFRKHNIEYDLLRSNDIAIFCPFHEHSGTKKHLRIKFQGTPVNCWVCGGKGHYNVVAEKLGLQKLPVSLKYSVSQIETDIESFEIAQDVLELPKGLVPFSDEYRGIPSDFLKNFNSSLYFDPLSKCYRILWPITFNGEFQGYTARALDESILPRYRNGPDLLFRAKRCFFGIDFPGISETIVLTEGPYSALRFLYEDIPAVGILGSEQWSKHKAVMLSQRNCPIKNVLVCMDGDQAGDACRDYILPTVEDLYNCEVFNLPRGKDPGDCSSETINQIKDLLEKFK